MDRFNRAMEELQAVGLLLLTDGKMPSLAALIAGERISGSWWGHPAGKEIFAAAQTLEDNPDVLTLKLISGKVTFVWRTLWNDVVSVGLGHEEWQYAGLNEAARHLKSIVDGEFRVPLDRLREWHFSGKAFRPEASAVELEKRLLVHVTSEHTEAGKHSKVLQTWENWAVEASFSLNHLVDPLIARNRLELRLCDLNSSFSARATLPWSGKSTLAKGDLNRT
jgi:hypothetical protein